MFQYLWVCFKIRISHLYFCSSIRQYQSLTSSLKRGPDPEVPFVCLEPWYNQRSPLQPSRFLQFVPFFFVRPCSASLKCSAVQASSYTSVIRLYCCLWSAPRSPSSCNLSNIQHRRRVPAPDLQFSHIRLFSEQISETFKSRSGVSLFMCLWFLVWRSDHSRKSVPLVPLHFSAQVVQCVLQAFWFYIPRVLSSASFCTVLVCTVPLCTVLISLHIGTLVASAEDVAIFNYGVHYVVNLHVFKF